ncbi:protein CcmA, bactofilin family [Desulfonatronum thiosulfatophilum]|uniref:Protein CcmA, bactofilin family n=1 Tax=Desulfonatronum thiosulfatophilum TaxID=617002 RepID=A0A1G6C303_9BACT|nr:polymer-forming cytoskeletal protein [Desulfonatronum thiosulfatophilum]SDB27255.1 protein CcmA, bactofilin family [Desulfonatronum thiosulfatophilum]
MAKDEINAFLGAGTSYEGKLQFQGSVRIDGNFLGRIDSEGTLIVGQDAKIDGEVNVGSLILSGFLKGQVIADNKVILNKTANMTGTMRTPSLVIEEGAVLDGEVIMSKRNEANLPAEEFVAQP